MSQDTEPDLDLHITGEGRYINYRTWKLVVTPDELAIVPDKTPWVTIIVLNSFFLSFFGSVLFIVLRYGDNSPAVVISLIGGTALMTCGLYTGLALWMSHYDRHRGPWLIVDIHQGTVQIPRHGLSVSISDVDHLQAITSGRHDAIPGRRNGVASEFNIFIRDGDITRRYHMLSCSHPCGFDALATKIADLKLLPVKVVHRQLYAKQAREKWLTPQNLHRADDLSSD